MRARNIKPDFFKNESLADLSFYERLLFIGLWCYADREGRFENRPKRIKAELFPYDNVNIEKALCNLMSLHFITLHDGVGYIINFTKHQHPHPHEAKSTLPPPPKSNEKIINEINVIACHDNVMTTTDNVTACQADIRIVDIMIPDIRIDNNKPISGKPDNFSLFWNAYPKKVGKGEAEKCFKKANPDIDLVLNALSWQIKSKAWCNGYIPNPSTYLNQRRWEDEPEQVLVRDVVTERGVDMLQGAQNILARRLANNGADSTQTASLVQIGNGF